MLVVVHVHVNERRRDGWSRRERNERKDEYPEEGGRLGVEVVGIVEGERVVGEDSRDGLFDLRSRLPPLRFQLFSSFFFLRLSLFLFNNFPFFPLYRVVEREREGEREGEDENFAGSMEKIESQRSVCWRCERFIRYSYGCYMSKYVKYMRAICGTGGCVRPYVVYRIHFIVFFLLRCDLS